MRRAGTSPLRFARTCRWSLSSDDVNRCGHRKHRQDNTQAAYTAPRVNVWDNPIKRSPQLWAVTMTPNRPGDKALRMRRDHLNLLEHTMLRLRGRLWRIPSQKGEHASLAKTRGHGLARTVHERSDVNAGMYLAALLMKAPARTLRGSHRAPRGGWGDTWPRRFAIRR